MWRLRGGGILCFPSLITWNLRVPHMLHLFGFVFNFCFHHLKLTKMSYEWVKMKKKKKWCFWVIEIELWWHFYNFTHQLGPTVNVPAPLFPQRLSLNPYQTSPSFMILLLFSSSSQAVPFLSPYPLVYEFNKPSTWITKFFYINHNQKWHSNTKFQYTNSKKDHSKHEQKDPTSTITSTYALQIRYPQTMFIRLYIQQGNNVYGFFDFGVIWFLQTKSE